MKTAISIPEEIFEQVDQSAKRLGISRSELFTRAVRAYLGALRDARITESYDRAFEDFGDEDGEFRQKAERRVLLGVEWNDQ